MFREANPLQALALRNWRRGHICYFDSSVYWRWFYSGIAGRMMAVGAAEGGAYAFNTGEGGFQDRISRVPAGAATGAVVNPVASTALRKGGDGLKALVRSARNLVGRRGLP